MEKEWLNRLLTKATRDFDEEGTIILSEGKALIALKDEETIDVIMEKNPELIRECVKATNRYVLSKLSILFCRGINDFSDEHVIKKLRLLSPEIEVVKAKRSANGGTLTVFMRGDEERDRLVNEECFLDLDVENMKCRRMVKPNSEEDLDRKSVV